jgi:hypothetical protein
VQKIQDVLLLLVTQISPLDSAKITRRQEKKKPAKSEDQKEKKKKKHPNERETPAAAAVRKNCREKTP